MMELMPHNKRGLGSSLQAVSWGIGSLVIASIAWIGGVNLDWRWLVRIPSLIAIPVLIAVFWIPESPRYYVYTNDNKKLIESVQHIAEINSSVLPEEMTVDNLDAIVRKENIGGERKKMDLCEDWFRSVPLLFCSRKLVFLLLPLFFVWLFAGKFFLDYSSFDLN